MVVKEDFPKGGGKTQTYPGSKAACGGGKGTRNSRLSGGYPTARLGIRRVGSPGSA